MRLLEEGDSIGDAEVISISDKVTRTIEKVVGKEIPAWKRVFYDSFMDLGVAKCPYCKINMHLLIHHVTDQRKDRDGKSHFKEHNYIEGTICPNCDFESHGYHGM